ncbi:YNFM family putative membrane transporter [Amycolatopsis bartoniae]|uniref:Putative transporter n=1 Tax=Amycolatopsis bartoniae TaxID=941986 RepID=A0A8H9IZ72_9PSEU|nr:MFS transporter [Amycolatopsis bartoniae]MBB2936767.1 YNFM family putative membrane transporter [Amycolatopsis bartoniae]TVT09184.1 MFS transporter [Amycolatopsis bartoniae]GHF49978.1 putative transporter [Amycolatopsis bartoniae]
MDTKTQPAVLRHLRGTPGFRRITLALFASGLATFTTLYCVQALLPALSTQFGLSPAESSLAVSFGTAGLAVGVIPLTALSGVVGRTPMMTVSLFTAALLGIAQALSPSFTVLLVLRALQGLALAGLQATAMSYLSEEIDRRSLGYAMGLYIAGNGIGGMAGRLIGSLVLDLSNWRWALAVVGLVALGCAVVFRVAIVPSAFFVPSPPRVRHLAASVGRAFTDSGLLRLFACGFLLMGCFVTVYNYLGFRLLAPPFALSPVVVGLIFVVYLAGSVSSTVAGRLVDVLGRPRMLPVTAVLTLAGLVLMLSSNLVVVVVGLVITTGGFFAAHSVASGWVGPRSATLGVQGPAVYLFCYYLGSSVGGSVGGLAYGADGWRGVSYYAGAFVVAVLVLAFTLRKLPQARPR